MREMLVLAALAAVLSACGSSTTTRSPSPIVFGVTGGNLVPIRVTIAPGGEVRASRSTGPRQKRLSSATLRRLQREVQLSGLSSRDCPGTLPDVASRFIRARGRTVTVHGGCESHFETLWNELTQAVGLQLG